MTTSNPHTDASRGSMKTLAAIFKSPASDAYNKVLANTADQAEGDSSSSDVKTTPLSDEEKARRLVEQRNANSPTGNFVLDVTLSQLALLRATEGIILPRERLASDGPYDT